MDPRRYVVLLALIGLSALLGLPSACLAQPRGAAGPAATVHPWVAPLCATMAAEFPKLQPRWPAKDAAQLVEGVRQSLNKWGPEKPTDDQLKDLEKGVVMIVASQAWQPISPEELQAQCIISDYTIRDYFQRPPLSREDADLLQKQLAGFVAAYRRCLDQAASHINDVLAKNGRTDKVPDQVISDLEKEERDRLDACRKQPLWSSLKHPFAPEDAAQVERNIAAALPQALAGEGGAKSVLRDPSQVLKAIGFFLSSPIMQGIGRYATPPDPDDVKQAYQLANKGELNWRPCYRNLQRVQGAMLFWRQALLLHSCLGRPQLAGPGALP